MFGSKARPLGPHRARARSAARLVAAPLVAFVLIIASGTAYADVEWEVKSVDGGYKAKIAPYDYPDGVNGAACEFLGYNWDSFSQEVKTNIAGDPDYLLIRDHRLKNLAYQYFEGDSQGVIGEALEAVGNKVVAAWTKLFGNDQIWVAECTYEEYGNARKAIQKWAYANDGTTGDEGGGSGGSGGGTNEPMESGVYGLAFTLPKFNEYTRGNKYYAYELTSTNANGSPVSSSTRKFIGTSDSGSQSGATVVDDMNIYIYGSAYNTILNYKNDGYGIVARTQISDGSLDVYAIPEGKYELSSTGIVFNDACTYYLISLSAYDRYKPAFYSGDDYRMYVKSGNTSTDNANAGTTKAFNQGSPIWAGEPFVSGGSGGGTESDPYVPTPNPKPDPPTPPTPPESGSTIINNYDYSDHNFDVHIDWPDIDGELNWDVVIEDPKERPTPTPYDPNGDVLHILQQILQAINSFRSEVWEYYKKLEELLVIVTNNIPDVNNRIGTAISQLLETLDDDIVEAIGELNSSIGSKIENRIAWLNQNVGDNITKASKDIRDEIYKDAKYIVDNLNFNADFDDSDIVLWLKRIYSRVKDRKVSVPSPDEDPQGWADAIGEFLAKILSMMVTGLDVAQIANLFDDLKNRFPISIPWDMVAILYLFDGEPVTPVFDWPIYDGENLVTNLHCDFSDFDDAMGYVRQGELLLFCIGLMYNTKWLMNVETQVIDHRKG